MTEKPSKSAGLAQRAGNSEQDARYVPLANAQNKPFFFQANVSLEPRTWCAFCCYCYDSA